MDLGMPDLASIRQRLGMAWNAAGVVGRPSPRDWLYNREHVLEGLRYLAGGDLEALQRFNPTVGFVSTPVDGIGAGFTDAGRLSTLLCPHTGFTHQVPYYAHDDGAGKPGEGAFAGVEFDGEVTWLWEDDVACDLTYRGRTGVLDLTYRGRGVRVEEAAYVYPGSETLVRDFTVHNERSRRLDGRVHYHTRANVTDEDQTFALWNSHWNVLAGGHELRWRDLQGPYALRVQGVGPDGAAETSVDGPLALGSTAVGAYLDGRLTAPIEVAPGGSATVSVFVAGGEAGDGADLPDRSLLDRSAADRQDAAEAWWAEWLADANVDEVPDAFADTYARSLVTLASLFDPASGSISAAPNLQPTYYPSWPRDNAFAAIALARAGKPGPATAVLAEFCPQVQEPDGSFRQCYNSRGEFAGIIDVENDQQPLYAWAVREVYAETGDDAFLDAAWPAVRRALDYTVGVVDGDGLLEPSPDIAEYPDDVRQSLWTNTFAYRGLLDGAELAAERGEDALAERYRAVAETVGDAVRRAFIDGEEAVSVADGRAALTLYDACALHPTQWAYDYEAAEPLSADLLELAAEWDDWIPGNLLLASTFYASGERAAGDHILDEMRQETTAAGHLAETRDRDGRHYFASPLAWSHAAFVDAVVAAVRH